MGRSYLVLSLIAVYATLAERLFFRVSSGGRGILPILELVVPFIAVSLLVLERPGTSLQFYKSRRFRLFVAPYLVLTISLPLLGFLWNDYPARTVLTALPGLRAVAFISFGCWLVYSGKRTQGLAARVLFSLICLESLLAVTQYGHNHGLLSGPPFEWQYRWDIYSQFQYSDRYLITGRSIGTFINPNELGFWSVVCVWLSAMLFEGWYRVSAVAAALLSLFLSQSRGSLFALTGSLLLWFGYVLYMRRRSFARARLFFVYGSLVLLLSVSTFGVLFQDNISKSPLLTRFGAGIRVLSQGASADQNAQGRVLAWKHALVFYSSHLAGTWGEPQMRFGSYMDNDYVRILLQGSPFFLGTFLMLLIASIFSISSSLFTGPLLAVLAISISINGISANPVSYTAISFFWMLIGFHHTRLGATLSGPSKTSMAQARGVTPLALTPSPKEQLV